MVIRRKKRSRSRPARPPRELSDARRKLIRMGAWLALVAAVGTGAYVGLKCLESQVTRRGTAAVRRVQVAFTVKPEWMPISLARQIAAALLPPDAEFADENLAADVYARAAAEAWVARVNKVTKRLTDQPQVAVVEIDCQFRKPVARVISGESGEPYAYVDADGVRLPGADVPQWMVQAAPSDLAPSGRLYLRDGDPLPGGADAMGVHYIGIIGVEAPPPPVGQRWAGGDIQDGLRLVSLVMSRSYANQITTVDVRNYDGRISRIEPHLRMYAQIGDGPRTDIRFGRFPAPGGGDYEVSPEAKMSHLDDYFVNHGSRLAGLNSYIDLQYDHLIYSIN